MKKFLALIALTASFAAGAVTFGEVTFTGPAFSPQPLITLSTVPGPSDNFLAAVGGRSATFLGNSLSLYSTTLPGVGTAPPTVAEYVSKPISDRLADFLTFTAPLVTNATSSAAVQVGVWSIVLGPGFDVVGVTTADLAIRNQALDWLEVTPSTSTTWNAFSLDNKSYTGFVYATPVPEPSTLLMLAMGFALVGIAVIKRRRPV